MYTYNFFGRQLPIALRQLLEGLLFVLLSPTEDVGWVAVGSGCRTMTGSRLIHQRTAAANSGACGCRHPRQRACSNQARVTLQSLLSTSGVAQEAEEEEHFAFFSDEQQSRQPLTPCGQCEDQVSVRRRGDEIAHDSVFVIGCELLITNVLRAEIIAQSHFVVFRHQQRCCAVGITSTPLLHFSQLPPLCR